MGAKGRTRAHVKGPIGHILWCNNIKEVAVRVRTLHNCIAVHCAERLLLQLQHPLHLRRAQLSAHLMSRDVAAPTLTGAPATRANGGGGGGGGAAACGASSPAGSPPGGACGALGAGSGGVVDAAGAGVGGADRAGEGESAVLSLGDDVLHKGVAGDPVVAEVVVPEANAYTLIPLHIILHCYHH